ncbi:MAG: lysophospholipid acyltransferase family protein [Nocardioidaceae bacterium]
MTDLPDVSGLAPVPERWIWAARLFVNTMLRRFDNHVTGAEHLPRHGPVVLASNHMGYLDGPLLVAVSPRPVHALVKETMFDGRLGWWLSKCGQIRVDRYHTDPFAVKQCLRLLGDGGVVAIYPEGSRGRGDVSTSKGGAAYLSLVTGAPVVPVACLGTRADGASTGSMPSRGARIDTVFGPPVTFDPVPWPRTKKQVASANSVVQEALAAHVRAACQMTGQTLPAMPTTETS